MDAFVLCVVTALLVSSAFGAPPRRGLAGVDDDYDDLEADARDGYRFRDDDPETLQITCRHVPAPTTACPRRPAGKPTTTVAAAAGPDVRKVRRRRVRVERDGPPRRILPVTLT